jgi:hypothetical protein
MVTMSATLAAHLSSPPIICLNIIRLTLGEAQFEQTCARRSPSKKKNPATVMIKSAVHAGVLLQQLMNKYHSFNISVVHV